MHSKILPYTKRKKDNGTLQKRPTVHSRKLRYTPKNWGTRKKSRSKTHCTLQKTVVHSKKSIVHIVFHFSFRPLVLLRPFNSCCFVRFIVWFVLLRPFDSSLQSLIYPVLPPTALRLLRVFRALAFLPLASLGVLLSPSGTLCPLLPSLLLLLLHRRRLPTSPDLIHRSHTPMEWPSLTALYGIISI